MTNGSSLALAWRENVGATKNNAVHSLSIDLENSFTIFYNLIEKKLKYNQSFA